MLLLHIADIHFRAPNCINPDTDPDRPFRTRMVQDVRERIQQHGPVGALLIGGDIAFKGDPEEYKAAIWWLEEFADACGCPMERVFVIPGNHDIDRRVIINSPAVRNAQAAIVSAAPHERERELRTQFADQDCGRALVAPLEAYNDFAKLFNCQIYPPDRLYWKQGLLIEGGVHLMLHGLTSTLLSGVDGKDDNPASLYLSPLQTVLDPVDDVVNLVLCHHPPDWFLDQDEVNDAICGRATIQLFAHKHQTRITRDEDYIRVSTGAVNPDRYEVGWQPSYNLIDISVLGQDSDRKIEIKTHCLEWQSRPELYRPQLTQQGESVFRHCIAIPSRVASLVVKQPSPNTSAMPDTAPNAAEEADADKEVAMSDEDTRNLVFRFWNLTVSQRREIALHLDLIDENELVLPEPERYGRALLRAGKRSILDMVAREVAQRETQ
ncbi:MAG: metallophosphoesterase [Bryobacterales bacterium]|nr:metallophosphoesterase [Bryobacterales bacterium]MDE0294900.1 metallophosphoesterase [Bryobacterales bacterium]